MMTILRGLLAVSTVALGLGLALHLAGWAIGDRLVVGGLIVLVGIPVMNVGAAAIDELRRR